MNENCNDDGKILLGLCQGRGAAFNQAVACLERNCKPKIINWLRKHGIPADRAEEMWFDAFADAWINLCQKGKLLKTDFCGYLFAIARNKWRHFWRDKARPVETWDILPEPPPIEEPEERIPQEYIEECCQTLGQKCRNIIDDHDAGLSMEEIAEKYGLTVQSARQTKYRCWKEFVNCLKSKMGLN